MSKRWIKTQSFLLAEYNPEGPCVNANKKKLEHIIYSKSFLFKLFSLKSSVAANKGSQNYHQLIVQIDTYIIKTYLSDQPEHSHSQCWDKFDLYDDCVIKQNHLCATLLNRNSKLVETVLATSKMLHATGSHKNVIL